MKDRQDFNEVLDGVHLHWFGDADQSGTETATLQEYLNSEEGKEWFKNVASTLGFKTQEEIEKEKEGVAKKNKEVITKNTQLKEKLAELEKKAEASDKMKSILSDYEIAVDDSGEVDYDGFEEALSKLRSGGGSNDPGKVEELQRQHKRALRDYEVLKRDVGEREEKLKEFNELLQERDQVISNLLIDGAFRSSLATAGYGDLIIPNILPALRAKSNAQVQKDEDTGEYKAITDDGRTIEDWVKMWKDTDEGKALRLSALNNGGGARGSGSRTGGQRAWKDMSWTERTKLFQENPDLYRKLKAEAGKTE